MEVPIGEMKEFNTEVTESTEDGEKEARSRAEARPQHSLGDAEAAFEEAEEEIREEGEKCGGDGAGKDEGVTDEGHAAEDEGAEAAGTDGCGDGGDADGDDGCGSNAREDDSERKRKPDAEEDLRARHAHGLCGFQDRRVDTGKTDVSVTEDWKKCVKDERDDGGALADAADEWNGNEKPEESKAGDGLEDAGDTEGDGSQSGTLHDEHAKRDADENSDGHGDDYECEVIQRGAEDFATMIQDKGPRAHARAPGETERDEVKARTSAWSRRRNSCGVALATMRPAWSKTMREASRSASRRSWVTNTMVLPRRRTRALNSR